MDFTCVLRCQFNGNAQVRCGQHASSLAGPFDQFKTSTGKEVAKSSVFPFLWVVETVKVKMPDGQVACLVGFDHCIRWAFDTSLHTQGLQEMSNQRGFSSP